MAEQVLPFREDMVHGDSVRAIWSTFSQYYGTEVKSKADSQFMQTVGSFLDSFGVMDKKQFLEVYTTTINGKIYCPFTPGIPTGRITLWSQLVICAHEHTHVEQEQREGWVRFAAKYIASDNIRAIEYEAPAYRTSLELNFWRSGGSSDLAGIPQALAQRLKGYACGEAAIAAAEEALESAREDILAGNIVMPASIKLMQWLSSLY